MKRALLVLPFVLVACNGGKNQPNIELVTNMMDQISIKSQDWDPREGDKVQMRMPPDGTVPRGFEPYRLAADAVNEAAKTPNPFANDNSDDMKMRGQKYFTIYCSVCHGAEGKGDGPVASRLPVKRPPPLISDLVKGYTDGRIYHIIMAGQGVMGSYASQITDPRNRWAVINYIRGLQGKGK